MLPFSIVIITLNEESNIRHCIRAARALSNDIIVVDAGSTDATQQIAEQEGARVYFAGWKNYGSARNFGALQARHDWILALDADERPAPGLIVTLEDMSTPLSHQILRFRRHNFIAQQRIRYGVPGSDKVTRIYNRKFASWDTSPVHEKLRGENLSTVFIPGHLRHYCFSSLNAYRLKMEHYAWLSAEKYYADGRKPGAGKKYFSAFFNALKSFVFCLGFLEGRKGWTIARIIARYSWLKYFYLEQMLQEKKQTNLVVGLKKMEAAN